MANIVPVLIEADFIKSAQKLEDSPTESMSEVVFLGRSNVGKSSTINMLTGRKNLAKSSSTPGKTQLINFFNIQYKLQNERYSVRFVDLPGFGYAKVSKTTKEIWQKNLNDFIRQRVEIRLFVHLRDARHPRAEIDENVANYIQKIKQADQNSLTVFTKIDKLNQKEKAKLKKDFPGAIMLSNTKRSGGERVHKEIFAALYGVKFD